MFLMPKIKKILPVPKRLILALFLFIIPTLIFKIESQKRTQKVLGEQTQIKEKQEIVYFWERVVREKPDYRDGWLQLAAAYTRLGEKDLARMAIKQAKVLDPNNEVILSFEKLLDN